MKNIKLIGIVVVALFLGACHSANSGTYSVETSWGKVVNVHQPGDWYTTFSPGSAANEIDGRPWSEDVKVHTFTKDNAALTVTVRIQGRVDPDKVSDFINTFGLEDKARDEKINKYVTGATQTIGRDAIVQHDAYDIFVKQDEVQAFISDRMKEYMETAMACQFIAVQIIDKPVFDNPAIEQAASDVVAAQKLKQAADAKKAAAQTTLEKNQIENQIYTSSPQAFELEKLRLQGQIAASWAQHQGALVFGNGNNPMMIAPTGK
jgi:hypothetical protein